MDMSREFKEMPSDVSVRPYQPDDYTSVKRNLEEGGIFYDDMDSAERLEQKIKRNPGSVIVAERNGEVVGNVFLIEDGWAAFVFRLAVSKEHRKQGIGSGLMKAVEDEARKRGYSELHILVGEEEKDLQDYYEALGYGKGNLYRWMYREFSEPQG